MKIPLHFMPYANLGRPLQAVRMFTLTDFEATYAKRSISVITGLSPIENEGFVYPEGEARLSK